MSGVEGRCLCGAVRIGFDGPASDLSACHCDMCRRWSGSILMGLEVPETRVRASGPVKTYRSSDFAERAWCDRCGSALWFRDIKGPNAGVYELMPGLFENAAGARLTREVYADRCPEGYALADVPDRVSAAEYEKTNPHVAPVSNEGDAQ